MVNQVTIYAGFTFQDTFPRPVSKSSMISCLKGHAIIWVFVRIWNLPYRILLKAYPNYTHRAHGHLVSRGLMYNNVGHKWQFKSDWGQPFCETDIFRVIYNSTPVRNNNSGVWRCWLIHNKNAHPCDTIWIPHIDGHKLYSEVNIGTSQQDNIHWDEFGEVFTRNIKDVQEPTLNNNNVPWYDGFVLYPGSLGMRRDWAFVSNSELFI